MQAPGAILQIPAAPGPLKMCKNCHTKPRFQAYSCCGRTCAKAYRAKKRAQATVPGGTAPPAQPGPNGMCANCKVRPTHGSHRHCGKTCASMAARQSQPHNVPVIGYSAGYQVPPSPSYSPYGPPSPGYPGYPPQGYGYSPGGPSPYPYSPGPPMHPSPRGFGHPQRGGSRPPPPRRTPNRAPPRSRLSVAATDYGSEDEYPSESSDDDRRRPARRPISRREEEDSPSGSGSGYPTSEEEEEQGDRRRRDDRRSSTAQPRARPSQSRAASSSRGDGLCVVCRRFPKHSGHPFCSRQCRDSLSLSQAQGIAPYPPRSDVPPAYSDTEDR